MPALWIAHVTVTDADAYGKYAKLAGPAIAKHGGKFIARGGRYVQLEGKDRPLEDTIATMSGILEDLGPARICRANPGQRGLMPLQRRHQGVDGG